MNVSTVDYHCTQDKYNISSSAQTSEEVRNSTFGPLPNYELKLSASSKQQLKPEWLQPKDATKRKRVNRTAKLKQCKLDARREQWLSRGSGGCAKNVDQDCHDTARLNSGVSAGLLREQRSLSDSDCQDSIQEPKLGPTVDGGRVSSTSIAISLHEDRLKEAIPLRWKDINQLPVPELNNTKNCTEKAFRSTLAQRDDNDVLEVHGMTMVHKNCFTDRRDLSFFNMHLSPLTLASESNRMAVGHKKEFLLTKAGLCRLEAFVRDEKKLLVSNVQKLDHSDVSTARLLTNSFTSSECAGSASHSHPYDGEDDWEAVADAIYVQGGSSKAGNPLKVEIVDKGNLLEGKGKPSDATELECGVLKPEYKCKARGLGGRTRDLGGKAWRPDDAARPPSLPRPSKQHNFPLISTPPAWSELHGDNLWGPPPAPLFCPICTEELDVTDTSFMPCSCGFRLCLFCHHRIASDDGRCPGCRKTYNSEVAMKLSRTCSVWFQI